MIWSHFEPIPSLQNFISGEFLISGELFMRIGAKLTIYDFCRLDK